MYMERGRVILHADTRSSHHNTGRYLRLRRSNTQEKKKETQECDWKHQYTIRLAKVASGIMPFIQFP